MFPLARFLYMPTTLLGPVPVDFSSSSTIPLYNTALVNNPFNLCPAIKFERNVPHRTLYHGYKRIRDESYDPQQKKRPKSVSTQPSVSSSSSSSLITNNESSSKHALMLLHELKPSVEYKLVAQTGPSHRPIFTMAVEINGQIFEGMAQTKKEAKQAAAEKALRSFPKLPSSLSDNIFNDSELTTTIKTSTEHNDNIPRTITSPDTVELREIQSGLSPLSLLNQLKPDAHFEAITDETISHFKFAVIIDNQRFIGTGYNEKMAKTKAAQFALEQLLGMSFDKEGNTIIDNDSLPVNLPYSRHDLADRIALCINEKFKQLTHHDIRLQRRKVLSGVVLIRNLSLESMEIICLTTGTKCHTANHLTQNGQSLNDCHAEIIARRCLIRYCYEQLNLLIDEKSNESVFEKIDNTKRFRLKSSITFHLYISTAPCGDSRLFSPQEVFPSELLSSSKHSLRKSCGLLRTKTEVGEGTIPVLAKTMYQNMQIWDNILDSERLLTMSCSDKLCRWNFIGLQGALLSMVIDPIYYTGIIIGSLYHGEQIRRALFARIEQIVDNVPSPYRLRRPFISGVSSSEVRTTSRAPNHVFIWNCVDKKYEIIDTFSGLTISRESSMVSKAALFQQWLILMRKIQSEIIPTIYSDAKRLALDYQMAKSEVNKAFQKSGFGHWIVKPHQQDEFDLSSSEKSLPCQSNESID